MGLSPTALSYLIPGIGNAKAAAEINSKIATGIYGNQYYVDTFGGGTANDGLSWASALSTMSAALTLAQTGDTVFFRGDVREQLVGSNLKFDITIVGVGSLHYPDLPSVGSNPGSSTWRAPASPAATTPLLEVRGRGWNFVNINFAGPTDAASVQLHRNALADASEFDPSHASFIGCRFQDAKYAIQDNGGCYHVTVERCAFKAQTTAAIVNTSTAVANPLNWTIRDCQFPSNVSSFGNATHIDSPLNCSVIRDSVFGTVTSTGLYIDLTGGSGNIVWNNILLGVYATSDYVAGTGDQWYGNRCVVTVTQAPDGVSILNPA
jgi:hypothetical protein